MWFVADPYLNEMGITSPLYPRENSSSGRDVGYGSGYDPVDEPEDDGEDIEAFADFMRATKVPACAAATPEARAGEALFTQIGGATCNTASIAIAPPCTRVNGGTFTVPPALGSKIIHPYSDFLLHDVGTGNGIPLLPTAEYAVTARYNGLTAAQKSQLLAFLGSLRGGPGNRLGGRLLARGHEPRQDRREAGHDGDKTRGKEVAWTDPGRRCAALALFALSHSGPLAVFVQLKRAPLSIATRIAEIPGVAQVRTRVVLQVTLDVPGLDEPASGRLVSIPERPRPMLNDLSLRAGRYVEPGRDDEVIASEAFTVANGLKVGDILGAVINGRWKQLRIVGVALSPEYIYEVGAGTIFPDNRRFGVLWMGEEALGVEEQRVNVIADFVDPPGALGDAYRVEARVVLWSGEDILKVPVSALFRRGERWNVFVVEAGRARRRGVEIGQRGALEVQIVKGLNVGEQVIRHPSNEVDDGRRVRVAR